MSFKNQELFTTPHYQVKKYGTDNGSKVGNVHSDLEESQLEENYAQFLTFRSAIEQAGFLVDGLVSFEQDKVGSRAIFYRIEALKDFFMDVAELKKGEYLHGNMPDMFLFQAHLQKPVIFGFSPSKFIKSFPESFSGFDVYASKAFNVSCYKNDAVSYNVASGYLTAFMDRLGVELKKNNIEDSMSNRLKFWAAFTFVVGGHGLTSKSNQTLEPELITYILDLVKNDLPLYHIFLFLSKSTNPQYSTVKRIAFSAEDTVNFVDVPRSYLHYIVSDGPLKAQWAMWKRFSSTKS